MKTNRFLLVGLLLAIFSMSFAQTSENYYTYSQKKSHYYDSLRAATPDTLKVPGMRSFQRWNDPRLRASYFLTRAAQLLDFKNTNYTLRQTINW